MTTTKINAARAVSSNVMPATVMSADDVMALLHREFPQHIGVVTAVDENGAVMRLDVDDSHLRSGGTVSGH